MRESLLGWFDRDARSLPWRTAPRDPYRTLVAEAMLQQTQAARAAAAFVPFVRAFPSVAALAGAGASDVLSAWHTLGYYRRARSLHAAARLVVDEHRGVVPGDVDGLSRLPGIGRYTAVAVAAQAFGVPGIAVDANVRRVGARVLGLLDAPIASAGDRAIERGLAALLLSGGARERRARVTEALIELGALVCTRRRPVCPTCPLATVCAARAHGEPEAFGAGRPRAPARLERSRALVAVDGDAVALIRRDPSARWGGLWGFPTAADAPAGRELPVITHLLSHRRLQVTPVLAGRGAAPPDAAWVPLDALGSGTSPLPVSTLERKVAKAVAAELAAAGGAA